MKKVKRNLFVLFIAMAFTMTPWTGIVASAADYPPSRIQADQRQLFFDLMDEYLNLARPLAFKTDCHPDEPAQVRMEAIRNSLYRRYGPLQVSKQGKPLALEDAIHWEAVLAGASFGISCIKGYEEGEVKKGMRSFRRAEEMMREYSKRYLLGIK